LLRKSIKINPETVEQGKIIQFNKNGEGQYSYYTNDYKTRPIKNSNSKNEDEQNVYYSEGYNENNDININVDNSEEKLTKKIIRNSIVHIYDKVAKYYKDNQMKHKELTEYEYPIRFEFKLFRNNNDYMSIKNIKGNYNEVLSRYLELLATIFNRYIYGNVEVKGKSNKEMAKVIRKSREVGTRYRGKKLVKTEPIPRDKMNGKHDDNDQMKYMILEQKMRIGELSKSVVDCYINDESLINLVDSALDD